ncbi:MAG: glycosyltransferase family 39 protein [Myxococcota bacterium]
MPWGKLQRLGAAGLLTLSLGFFAYRCGTSQEIPFITQSDEAPWIMAPAPVSAKLQQWGREQVPVVSFRRSVHSDGAEGDVTLTLRALRGFAVKVDGEPLPGGRDDGARWRERRQLALGPALEAGWNQIEIDVAHAHGPALVSLRIEGLPEVVTSDATWAVYRDGELLGHAIPADDTRRNPAALAVETPARALRDAADTLLAFFMAGLLAFLLGRRFAGEHFLAMLPFLVLGVAGVAWLVYFADTLLRLPIEIGFDARHHKLYVDILREQHAVPVATDGWSVYHPPLFYAGAALLEWLGEAAAGRDGGIFGLKLIPFLAGLANVWVAAELVRRLFPDDLRRRALAAVFAAVLPMNLYAAAYFSNETLITLLAGLVVLAVVEILLARASTTRQVAHLGMLVGLALLTKFTAVLVGAVAIFFVVAKLMALEDARPSRVATAVAAFAASPLLIAGWFYARNVWLFGDPLIANWGDMPGPTLRWWQQPGFHTASFYLTFGESLSHPYLSAFRSVWDSLYSTLWGDGGIGGRVLPSGRHDFWNYSLMSSAYLVAIPATLAIALGSLRSFLRALHDPDPHRRAVYSFLLTLAYAVVFGLVYMSLRLPYFAQAKASYGLVVMPALTLFFIDGFAWCDEALAARGWLPARALLYGWLGLFAATCFFSYVG